MISRDSRTARLVRSLVQLVMVRGSLMIRRLKISNLSKEPGMLTKYSRLLKKYGVMASGYWPGESKTSLTSNRSSSSTYRGSQLGRAA